MLNNGNGFPLIIKVASGMIMSCHLLSIESQLIVRQCGKGLSNVQLFGSIGRGKGWLNGGPTVWKSHLGVGVEVSLNLTTRIPPKAHVADLDESLGW